MRRPLAQKQRDLSRLGQSLRDVRKGVGRTQAELAAQARIAVTTLHALERGRGRVENLDSVVAALAGEIRARGLPPAASPGAGLSELRRRRGLSKRTLAQMVPCARNSLTALERGKGTVSLLERVARALGVVLRIQAAGSNRYWTDTHASSAHHSWYTPPDILDTVLRAAGVRQFDLDPCSPARTGGVPARQHWTATDDGLELPWAGLVWVNPPYGRVLPRWVAKCAGETSARVLALLPARTDTRWWHTYVAGQTDILLFRGRLTFQHASAPQQRNTAPFPSALIVWRAPELARRIAQAFGERVWYVPLTPGGLAARDSPKAATKPPR